MSESSFFDAAVRLIVAVGMLLGAYRAYRVAKANGTWSGKAALINTLLALLFVVFGVVLAVGGGIELAPEHPILFGLLAAAYFIGGFYGLLRVMNRVEQRYGSGARAIKP